jgi:hypothetical protein
MRSPTWQHFLVAMWISLGGSRHVLMATSVSDRYRIYTRLTDVTAPIG